MDKSKILSLYDNVYAATYNRDYLLGENFRECTEYEISLIKSFLKTGNNWLDVACGTGYFLSRFPTVERAGLDISPAMLDQARRSNPGVTFVEGDYLVDYPEWYNKWDIVSCMWYAYAYSGCMSGVENLVRNMAAWTSQQGVCFLPICTPEVLCGSPIQRYPTAYSQDGRLEITGVIWNWVDEPSGRVHEGLIAPQVSYVLEMFKTLFVEAHVHSYPGFLADCLPSRAAIIAHTKRSG